MKKLYKNEDGYHLVDDQLLDYFPTLDALENHIKLLLVFVQNSKEKPVE